MRWALLSVFLFSCGPATAGTITKIGHLLNAASALQALAEQAADQDGTPEAGQLLGQELPKALEHLDVALGELCAPGGPLPDEHKVCRHYHAYKADPQ